MTLPGALTLSHPGPFTDQTITGFELIITTLLVSCLLHFLGSTSWFLRSYLPIWNWRNSFFRVIKTGERFEVRTEFLGERERIETAEGQSWALSSPR